MDKNVVDLVDRLLDTIKYEINRMKEMGEDTSMLENQLMEFRRDQINFINWIMNHDDSSVKLFLNRLLEFSKTVHRYYTNVQSGGHIMQTVHEKGEHQMEEAKRATDTAVNKTIDLITSDDEALNLDFGVDSSYEDVSPVQMDKAREDSARIMDTSTPVDGDVRDIEDMIKSERELVDTMRKSGKDTLNLEFLISKQESLLVSLKEALLDGDYAEAQKLREEIKEIGRRI